jgi:streptomycin 6-kinase
MGHDAPTMSTDLELPPSFVRAIRTAHGEAGRHWLGSLPALVARCAKKWKLSIDPAYPLSYHYVAPARTAAGTPVVIKIAPPTDETLGREARVLERVAGDGTVLLLDREWDLGALLLERAVPGLPIASRCTVDDEEATRHAAGLLQRLWRPCPSSLRLPTVSEHARAFDRYRAAHQGHGPLPQPLIDKAEHVFGELVRSSDEQTLLHGDLHHGNILSATRSPWLAIDPHGVCGERAYDCASLLYNPHRELRVARHLEGMVLQRVEVLADRLGLDAQRVLAWGFAKAVLSEIWAVEDHGEVQGVPLHVARVLASRLT